MLPNCAYSNGAICYSCYYGYHLSAGTCTYINWVSGCQFLMYDGTCAMCYQEYSLSADQTTCTYIVKCRLVDISGNCVECYNNYILSGGVCTYVSLPNCQSTKDGVNCDICNYEYVLNSSGQCEDRYCFHYNQNNECISCRFINYRLSGTTCIPAAYCQYFDNYVGKCVSCFDGFFVNGSGDCVACPYSNCAQCSTTKCLRCYDNGYFVDSAGICGNSFK